MKNIFNFILATIVSFVFFKIIGFQYENLHLVVYSFNIASIIVLINKLGKSIIISEFIAFSAISLWLSVPLLMWDLGVDKLIVANLFGKEILAINKLIYFNWAIPATLAMVFGLYLNSIQYKNISLQLILLKQYLLKEVDPKTPFKLFLVGLVSLVFINIVPTSLRFVFFMLTQFTYVSVLYCLFGNFKHKKLILWGAVFVSLISVASSGMFGELIWWGLLIFIYFLLEFNLSAIIKISILLVGMFSISILQSVKNEYRRITWVTKGGEKPGLILLSKTTFNALNSFGQAKKNNLSRLFLYRANQAYIVSLVMKHVPNKEPFAKGETVFGSLLASFVPRLLWADKPSSGGKENMLRFTGFKSDVNTSYDIGQIGDAWANFGYWGGIIFLFLYGFGNSWLFKFIFDYSSIHLPGLILWIPIVFLQLLKVEVSVVTNFNAAIKGAFFIALVFLVAKKLKIKL